MSYLRLRRKRSEGAVMVEMALSLMLMIFLTFGAMEYGWMFFRLQQVTNAVHSGARQGVVPSSTTADITTAIDGIMDSFGMGGAGYTVTVTPAEVANAARGDMVTVSISVPYGAETGLLQMGMFPTPQNLTSSITMAREGP